MDDAAVPRNAESASGAGRVVNGLSRAASGRLTASVIGSNSSSGGRARRLSVGACC